MIFLGVLFKKSEEDLIASKSRGAALKNQANAFQWNCIDGLYENGVKDLCIVNALPVGCYPKRYTDLVIPSIEWEYRNGKHFQVGSFNVPVLKQYGRYRRCKKILHKLQDKEIIIYSPYQPFLKAIKKLDKSYNITLIVPDLPQYYDYRKVGKIKKILRYLNNRSIEKCMVRVDRFVLLTDAMKEPLGVGNRPYTVVEGICNRRNAEIIQNQPIGKKVILYTGSLNKKFGIDILLEAFTQIARDDYELWICGGGDYQESVKEASEKDARIKFLGYVSSTQVTALRGKAVVLVNPRQNVGEYTKYSFPSKTMEYLLSGKPVIAYKLDGIPEEYDQYFYYVKDNTAQSLARAIVEVCEDESGRYAKRAKEAVEFILSQKNPKTQVGKIIELMGIKA